MPLLTPYSLATQGYVKLNTWQIQDNLDSFHKDRAVENAYNMITSSLLSGGILFNSKSSGDSTSRFDSDEEAEKWRQKVFSNVSREAYKHYVSTGVVVYDAVEDEENENRYGLKPIIRDLREIDVYFLKDTMTQKVTWRVFEKQNLPNNTPWHRSTLLQREIETARVFCVTMPSLSGELMVGMPTLVEDRHIEEKLQNNTLIATALRANPMVLSQQVEEKMDENKLYISKPVDRSNGVVSVYLGDGKEAGPIKGSQAMAMRDKQLTAGCNEVAKRQAMSSSSSNTKETITPTLIDGQPVYEFRLDENRTYVRHVLPESPAQDYFAFRVSRAAEVFMWFGIPYSMLSEQSPMGGKQSMNENAATAYMDTQKKIKQQLMQILRDIYKYTVSNAHAIDYIKNWAEEREKDETELKENEIEKVVKSKGFQNAVDVDVQFPGMPPMEVVDKLYLMKAVTWDYYKSVMHAMYNIPMDAFQTAEPPNEILEAIKEKEIGSTKPKASAGGGTKRKK